MNAIKSLGTTRALITCAVQFNSLFLRTMAGLGKWLPLESISIITSVEFFLNFLFELPFGIYADRKGRLPFVISGLTIILISVLLTGVATLLNGKPQFQILYIIGILIGIGKPMFSGALEAYYQNFVRKFHDQDHKNSFLLSNLYGKYLTSFVFLFTVAVVAACFILKSLLFGFAIGALIYLIAVVKILNNSKSFGPEELVVKQKSFSIFDLLNSKLIFGYFLNASFFFLGSVILNYSLTSLTVIASNFGEFEIIYRAGAYMFGFLSSGWLLKAKLLPKLSKFKNRYTVILISSALYSLTLFIVWRLLTTDGLLIFALVLFGTINQIYISLLKDMSMNELLTNSKPDTHSTVLSFSNLPGYLIAGTVPLYFNLSGKHIPSMEEIFRIGMIGAFSIGVISYLLSWSHLRRSMN